MKKNLLLLMVVLMGAGCVTTQQRRVDQARRAQDVDALKADVYRLKEQMGGVAASNEGMHADIERLRRERADGDKELSDRLDQMEGRLRQQDAAIDAMHKRIISELSQKMAKLLQSQAPAPGSQYGREHVVRSGQTLSEIASAYGVTVNAIVRANGLKNANSIRAGQKLFIPE